MTIVTVCAACDTRTATEGGEPVFGDFRHWTHKTPAPPLPEERFVDADTAELLITLDGQPIKAGGLPYVTAIAGLSNGIVLSFHYAEPDYSDPEDEEDQDEEPAPPRRIYARLRLELVQPPAND